MTKRTAAMISLVILILLSFVACQNREQTAQNSTTPVEEQSAQKSTTPVVLYLPNDNADGFVPKNAVTDGTAENIVSLLVSEKVLPEGCTLNSFNLSGKNGKADMNAAYSQALRQQGTAGEYMLLGSLVNTLLTFYQLDTIMVTIDGEVLGTGHNIYDFALDFYENQIADFSYYP